MMIETTYLFKSEVTWEEKSIKIAPGIEPGVMCNSPICYDDTPMPTLSHQPRNSYY